jgi:hypothetical protein
MAARSLPGPRLPNVRSDLANSSSKYGHASNHDLSKQSGLAASSAGWRSFRRQVDRWRRPWTRRRVMHGRYSALVPRACNGRRRHGAKNWFGLTHILK